MENKIEIDKLAKAVAEELGKYTIEVGTAVKEAVTVTMKELLKNTHADAPKRTGAYKKAMATKKLYEDDYEKRMVWYVKKPHYRLAHLLEKGHANREGGRTKAYPHIEKNAEIARESFERRVREAIDHAGT